MEDKIEEPPAPSAAKYAATRAELNTARAKIQELEIELADFSSQVMEEANNQVGNANRKAADYVKRNEALNYQIQERDILIDSQKQQLDVLKQMITNLDVTPPTSAPQVATSIPDIRTGLELERALEFSQWTCPVEPVFRYDTPEYEQFLKMPDEQWFKNSKSLTNWKFAYQSIEHEVEPALGSVHMSWLARRAFLAAVVDGSLGVEPIGSRELIWATRPSNPCCLCGVSSDQPQYARLHMLKIPKDQQNYPVGNECIIRVRFACEYVEFLRNIFNGLRKLETDLQKQAAWRECVRLRQQLMWARVGAFWHLGETSGNRNFYVTLESLSEEQEERGQEPAKTATAEVPAAVVQDDQSDEEMMDAPDSESYAAIDRVPEDAANVPRKAANEKEAQKNSADENAPAAPANAKSSEKVEYPTSTTPTTHDEASAPQQES